MRVLIVKTSSMGDVIHTLPAVTDAVNALPNICFDWVVEEGFQEIPKWHPSIDEVIPVAIRRWRKQVFKIWKSPEWRSFKNEMKHHHYDCVIDAQGLMKSAFVTRFAKAPTYGFDKASAREPLATMAYDQMINVPKNLHAVERTRVLFAKSLGYTKPPGNGSFGLPREKFGKKSEDERSLVFLHSTTRGDKHWPEAHWLELCKQATDAGWSVKLPWHSETEKQRAQNIAAVSNHAEILPKLTLTGVASVLAEAHAFVAVDTGLGHLGAALDVPGVSLYGPTRPSRVGTYGNRQMHLSSDQTAGLDNHELMGLIEPDQVIGALQRLLEE